MVSSRRGRKHQKLGSQGFVQREQAVDGYPPSGVEKAIPRKVRETFPAKRQALAAEFAKVPGPQRRDQANAFRKRLREICASDLECRGFWQLKFEPLLSAAATSARAPSARAPRTPGKARVATKTAKTRKPAAGSRKPPPAEHAHTELAILAFVRRHPGDFTQKQLVQALCGTADTGEPGRYPEYGSLQRVPVDIAHARVASMTSRGFLVRDTKSGKLRPATA